MYLFLTLLGLCCAGFSLIVVVGAYFLVVASLVAEHGALGHVGFCGTWAQ